MQVALVSMPWANPAMPSIQVGILQRALEREGIPAVAHSFHLAFLDHLARQDPPLGLEDVEAVIDGFTVGLGDWIFAVPPFAAPDPGKDERFRALMARRGFAPGRIAAALRMREIAPSFLAECAEAVLADDPAIVGFTTGFNQAVPALALARILKDRRPGLFVVLGGANCEGPMGEALHRNFPWIDAVVRGEGERALPALARDVAAGLVRPQPGLCYREGGRAVAVPEGGAPAPLDEVPTPDYDEYFARLAASGVQEEIQGSLEVPFETARGCWWGQRQHCAFCGLNGSTMAFRSKSPARALAEMEGLARRYRQLTLRAVDNILDPSYLAAVMPRLRDSGWDYRLFWETKSNLRLDQIGLLWDGGVRVIQPGIESLSTPLLQAMRKGVTAIQNVALLKWCAAYGMDVVWNLIYGFPGEEPAEYAKMADLAPLLVHLPAPALIPLQIERFSPYFKEPERYGLRLLGPREHYGLIYDLSPADLADLAYTFGHAYADGRDPEAYVGPLRAAVEAWRGAAGANRGALRYRVGPGFVTVLDRRTTTAPADYTLEGPQAVAWLAWEAGAAPPAVRRALAADGYGWSDEEIEDFGAQLEALGLAWRDGARRITLALPEDPARLAAAAARGARAGAA